jgi:hypothetical protein
MILDQNLLLFFASIVFLFEFVKFFNSQPFSELISKQFFAISLFLISPSRRWMRALAFIVIGLEITETISWFYTKKGFTIQILMAMDFQWALSNHIEIVWVLIGLSIVVFILVSLPIPSKPIYISFSTKTGAALIALTLAFQISRALMSTFDPFQKTQRLESLRQRIVESESRKGNVSSDLLVDYLRAPNVVARIAVPPRKPNLIILEVESLEKELLGTYNTEYPKMLRFLSRYVAQGTYFANVVSQPYTTWSVASLFAVQCNMPLLLHHVRAGDQGKFHLLPNIKCLGDFLWSVGYRLLSYQTNVFVGSFKQHLRLHHYESRDYKEHGHRKDWDLFAMIESTVFPMLASESRPFILHIANADSHAFPRYFADGRCKTRVPRSPAIVRSFDCVDQIIENFVNAFESSPLFATTDLVLYGDHVLMEGNYKQIKVHEPRALVLAWPYHEKKRVTKPVSLYDIAPTILKLLGIEYEPPMPFGVDLFSNKTGKPPTVDDFQTIHDVFMSEMKWDNNVTCRGGQGFCTVARS